MSVLDKGGSAMTLARGLGWFSVGLGVAELLAPRALARATGLPRSEGLLAGYGLREIATGVGVLVSDDPTPWIWGRVGGDVLDVGTLVAGLANPRADRGRLLLGLAAVAGVAALDVVCARALTAEGESARRTQRTVKDYSDRSGWSKPVEQMRGAARKALAGPGEAQAPPARQSPAPAGV